VNCIAWIDCIWL